MKKLFNIRLNKGSCCPQTGLPCRFEGPVKGQTGASPKLTLSFCVYAVFERSRFTTLQRNGGSHTITCVLSVKMALEPSKASSSILKHPQACILKHPQASSSIPKHPQASPSILKHPQASSGILKHPHASSRHPQGILRHPQASSGILKHPQASSSFLRLP